MSYYNLQYRIYSKPLSKKYVHGFFSAYICKSSERVRLEFLTKVVVFTEVAHDFKS
jgi:hypothetical protein